MNGRKKARFVMAMSILLGFVMIGVPVCPCQDRTRANDSTARLDRIENGIEPVDLAHGEKVKLSLAELMRLYHDPGLSVAIIDNYQIAWAKGYGVTDSAGKLSVTPRTLFQAGSISKPVAATGMLALVQAGKLSLDEDVNLRLKSWKLPESKLTKEHKVTLRRLASHTAGTTVHGFPGYDVDENLPTIPQILDGQKPLVNTEPVRVDLVPGTQERYSGGGVTIEQLVMTDVTGRPFPQLMKDLVFDEIGMTDSSYEQPLSSSWQSRTATGTYVTGKSVHGRWHIYPEMAAAGLWTTPTDLAKFAIEIALSRQARSNKVLAEKTIVEMFTHPPSATDFGIGIALPAERPGEFGHNGADEGFQALLVMNADTGQGVAIMANSDNGLAIASEYVRSAAIEYGWKYQREARSDVENLTLIAEMKGADGVLARYEELKQSAGTTKVPEEYVLNTVGYAVFMQEKRYDEAVAVFVKNAQDHPKSSNVYDSLGEAYAGAGKKDLAIANYENSLKIDSKNEHAKEELNKLRRQQ